MFREMIRKNKQLSREECVKLLKTEKRGVLSVIGDGGYPYGMPMNHYYNDSDGNIYFHCGKIGHRLDSIKGDDKVSFCVCDKGYANDGEWALNVKSVIVFPFHVCVCHNFSSLLSSAYRGTTLKKFFILSLAYRE